MTGLIETMPSFCGKQLYPAGMPIPCKQIKIESEPVWDKYMRLNEPNEKDDDEKYVRDYLLYYLYAPCWDMEEHDLRRATSLSWEELFELCMDNGLDPF